MLLDFLLIQLFRSIIFKLFRQGFFELIIVEPAIWQRYRGPSPNPGVFFHLVNNCNMNINLFCIMLVLLKLTCFQILV
jgi:hypothetical protein